MDNHRIEFIKGQIEACEANLAFLDNNYGKVLVNGKDRTEEHKYHWAKRKLYWQDRLKQEGPNSH